jgi:protein-disulfide isomerase
MASSSSSQRARFNSDRVESASFRQPIVMLIALLLLLTLWVAITKAQERNVVVAVVNGQSITQEQVDEAAISQIFPLQQQIFAIRRTTLENLIIRRVWENEAARRKVTVEDLKRQVMSGLIEVTNAQVEELYQANQAVFALMSPDEAREKLRLDLEGQGRLKKYREAITRLRAAARIEVLLDEPRLPSFNSIGPESIGPANAKVVLTEYSDFQCPYCREVQSTVKQILRAYRNDVKLTFKHLPLEIHPLAFRSAQAAFCAGKQNFFWKFHDALFQAELSAEVLTKLAQDLGLDVAQYEKCVASAESRAAVLNSLAEAQQLGINSTPTFLINGKLMRGALSFTELKGAIERELKNSQTGSQPQKPQPKK